MDIDIFPWLVEHHSKTLDDFVRRESSLSKERYRLREGYDSNVPYHGFLFLVDGPRIFDNLNKKGIIHDSLEALANDYHSSEPLDKKTKFLDYLSQQELEGEDGAYIFNSVTGKIVRVSEINNNPKLPEDFNILERLPGNFVHQDDREVNLRNLGTKTRIALKIPASMENIHAYQIKRSPYGNKSTGIGMGKVTHFESFGLSEEFFFMRNDGVVVGVYRRYITDDKKVVYSPKDLIISDLSELEARRIETREQYDEAA